MSEPSGVFESTNLGHESALGLGLFGGRARAGRYRQHGSRRGRVVHLAEHAFTSLEVSSSCTLISGRRQQNVGPATLPPGMAVPATRYTLSGSPNLPCATARMASLGYAAARPFP